MIYQVPKSFLLNKNRKYVITGYMNGIKIFQFGNDFIDFDNHTVEIFTSYDMSQLIVFLEQIFPYHQIKL